MSKINTRITQKCDTSVNWAKATNFTPLEGEIIVYTDLNQIKIGDGETNVRDLPFSNAIIPGEVANSAILAGEYEGYSNEAVSQVSMALGAGSAAGLKGWYYIKYNPNKRLIWLSDTREGLNTPIASYIKITEIDSEDADDDNWVSGWSEGDEVTIVNGNYKYERCAQIESIQGNMIKLKTWPDFIDWQTQVASWGDGNFEPDEFSITAIKVTDDSNTKLRTVSSYDKGGIDFGAGSHAEGIQTAAVNLGAHTEGIQTVAYGQYAHAEGFKTQAGYSAHAEGKETIAGGEKAHAEGMLTKALGLTSHAEGHETVAEGGYSHAEGFRAQAIGDYSHAEGVKTEAKYRAHAEGDNTKAYGDASHAEGYITLASGPRSHAEGDNTNATANAAHAEGKGTVASGEQSHAEGRNVQAIGHNSHAEGDIETENNSAYGRTITYTTDGETVTKINDGFAHGDFSHREGRNTSTFGNGAHTEGHGSMAIGNSSHAEGYKTTAILGAAHAEGYETRAEGIGAHAEGRVTTAKGECAHAEGKNTVAQGECAHVEGKDIQALATGAHAEGGLLTTETATYNRKINDATDIERTNDGFAHGEHSHREGRNTSTYGNYSHAEGSGTMALGNASHAEGYNTNAIGAAAHAEGHSTSAKGKYSHAEGYSSVTDDNYAHAEGEATQALGACSHAEGYMSQARISRSHAEGDTTIAEGQGAHAEGSRTQALQVSAHAEGMRTIANGVVSHAEGRTTRTGDYERDSIASEDISSDESAGSFAHAEGSATIAKGTCAHAEGKLTYAEGYWSHAEGLNTYAKGRYTHAEGKDTRASADGAHAEGTNVAANDENDAPVYLNDRTIKYNNDKNEITIKGPVAGFRGSHAEGIQTFTGAYAAHAEGFQTDAVGQASHAEGWQTRAEGKGAHASGIGTKATKDAQTVVGRYNREDDNAKFIVGVGSSDNRQNAFTAGNDGANDYITIGETKLTESKLQDLVSSSASGGLNRIIVDTLPNPEEADSNTIYMLPGSQKIAHVNSYFGYLDGDVGGTLSGFGEDPDVDCLFYPIVPGQTYTITSDPCQYCDYAWIVDNSEGGYSDSWIITELYGPGTFTAPENGVGLWVNVAKGTTPKLLMKKTEGFDIYEEYMLINGAFELIGNTSVDLSDYVRKSELVNYMTRGEVKAYINEMFTTETWTMTLEDGSTVTKEVVVRG